MKNLERIKARSIGWYSIQCLNGNFKVRNISNEMYSAILKNDSCSFKKWDIYGVPCQHAVVAILGECEDPMTYVSELYYKEYSMRTYFDFIQQMTSSS